MSKQKIREDFIAQRQPAPCQMNSFAVKGKQAEPTIFFDDAAEYVKDTCVKIFRERPNVNAVDHAQAEETKFLHGSLTRYDLLDD